MGDVLKPDSSSAAYALPPSANGNATTNQTGNVSALGQMQQTGGIGAQATPQSNATGKVLTGDLDSSLASLAENLTINKSASAQVK